MVQKIGLFILMLCLAACSVQTAVEPTSVDAIANESTAVLPTPTTIALLSASPTVALSTPTLSTPRLDEVLTAVPEPEQPTANPTTAPLPTETPQPTPEGVVYGRTAEGAFFQGYANTPVTMIDYSDFL